MLTKDTRMAVGRSRGHLTSISKTLLVVAGEIKAMPPSEARARAAVALATAGSACDLLLAQLLTAQREAEVA
jgi:hypothetical protein